MGTIPAPNIAEMGGQIAAAPINALAEFARVAQLKQQTALSQQQTQAAAQENQMRQQQIADSQAMTQAMHDWDGKDPDALPGLLTKRGGSANAVMGLQKSVTDRKTQLATLDKDQLANMAAHHDAALGVLDTAKNVPDDQLSQHIATSAQSLQASGHLSPQEAQNVIQHSQSMPPDQFRPWLDVYEKGLKGEKEQIAQANTERETKVKEQNAASEAQKANAGDWKEGGGGTLVNVNKSSPDFGRIVHGAGPLDQQELTAYLSNPKLDAGVTKDAATFASWKAKQNPSALVLGNQLGKAGEGSAIDQAAERYASTGVLPSGFARSPGTLTAIMSRAAELHPEGDIAGNSAVFAANKTALSALQKSFSNVSAFENTAGKNLDVFLKQAGKVIDSGSPWINKPLRSLDAKALGDTDQAAFNTARTTALTEIAKVLNSPTGAGVLSDSARHEVEGLIGPDATLKQIVAAANILKQDMANRHQSYADEIGNLQKAVGQKGAAAGGGQQSAGHKVGDIVVQGGRKFKATAVDANGKITAADSI